MLEIKTVSMFFPAGLLYNTTGHTWHPFYFRLSPRPSDDDNDVTMRFRSGAHHTAGFASEAAAREHMKTQTKWKDTGGVWEWNGSDIPTITADFAVNDFLTTSTQIEAAD